MRRNVTPYRPAPPSWGSRLMLYGALALIVSSGYTLYVQWDTSRVWLTAIFNSNRARGSSAFEQLSLMIQTTPALRLLLSQMLFLLATVIIAPIVMTARKRPAACAVMIPVCGLGLWAGCVLDLYSVDPERWIRLLCGVPLGLIILGCILQLIDAARLARGSVPYQRPAARKAYGRVAAPPVKRSAPERRRMFRDAPGATRMLPDVAQPVIRQPAAQEPAPMKRMEKPVPDRQASHIGQPDDAPEQKPRYQWKTIKRNGNDNGDVIGQD